METSFANRKTFQKGIGEKKKNEKLLVHYKNICFGNQPEFHSRSSDL